MPNIGRFAYLKFLRASYACVHVALMWLLDKRDACSRTPYNCIHMLLCPAYTFTCCAELTYFPFSLATSVLFTWDGFDTVHDRNVTTVSCVVDRECQLMPSEKIPPCKSLALILFGSRSLQIQSFLMFTTRTMWRTKCQDLLCFRILSWTSYFDFCNWNF